jgi:GR25 family glycosyltransferase involved in LPS biosynthesis
MTTPLQKTKIYCINFNDEPRRQKMSHRFSTIGQPVHFTEPVYDTDPRITAIDFATYPHMVARTSAIMLQHLDSLKHFLDTTDPQTAEYCIVCEDDVLISRNFVHEYNTVMQAFKHFELDVLLLGCLQYFRLYVGASWYDHLYDTPDHLLQVFRHPDHLWGSQMYVVSRKWAEHLVEKYTVEYAQEHPDLPHNPDWIITKMGHRAMVYPMLAMEEGDTKIGDDSQRDFHRSVFLVNWDSERYLP